MHRDATEDLYAAIVGAPDRDRIPGARPIVSFDERDEPAYLASVSRAAHDTVAISRRGAWHGEWAILDPRSAAEDDLAARWHAARPIVLAHAAESEIAACASEIGDRAELHDALKEMGGLRRWLSAHKDLLEPRFQLVPARSERSSDGDPERDLERIFVKARGANGRKLAHDLWLKTGWLSTFEGEDSLRLRFSFGRERDDDASRDWMRHRLVAELAELLLPESASLARAPAITHVVERLCAEPILYTQHIAYWNSPDGGALFHHDAFVEEGSDGVRDGQLGVCYVQLSGRTAWLALAIDDLASRVAEYVEFLDEGEAPWVRAQLWPDARAFGRVRALVLDRARLVAELALPGCGALSALVNRGPEFTAFLADAGHAAVLEAGDAILLPNHGYARTAMHSVFGLSDEPAYSLSLAIRPDRDVARGGDIAELVPPSPP